MFHMEQQAILARLEQSIGAQVDELQRAGRQQIDALLESVNRSLGQIGRFAVARIRRSVREFRTRP